jgi:hypothetical protein
MKYSQFSKIPNVIMNMLFKLKVFEMNEIIIKINNFPDYDISGYNKDMSDYYFCNSWKFENLYDSVLDINILSSRIYHADDFRDRLDWDDLQYLEDDEKRLNEIHFSDDEWFADNGCDTSYDEFELKNFRLKVIDNSEKRMYYEGSFFGDDLSFEMIDHGIYALIKTTAISTTPKPFYKELLGESVILRKEKKAKLSFFMMYSALESYVNTLLSSEDTEGRLLDKIKELFKKKYSDLNSNLVYSSLINEYSKLTNKRNIIAHGRESLKIEEADLDSLMLFVVTLIFSYSHNCISFNDIIEKLENGI